jgi:hypothetical protein
MITCPSHKKVYLTAEIAEDALIEARTKYDYADGNGPVGVYQCEDCGYYHLTSKGAINPRLEQMQRAGELDRKKQGAAWEQKIRNRKKF